MLNLKNLVKLKNLGLITEKGNGMMNQSYLNIAAGKIFPIDYREAENSFLLQLDTMYLNYGDAATCENNHRIWLRKKEKDVQYCNMNAFEFLGFYKYQFDNISFYRFLEHITKPEVMGFIYLVSTATKIGGIVDVIVPNYETLAKMILSENLDNHVAHIDWERHDTILTYELLNEPSMPHASIWTPSRLQYFFELEQRFQIEHIDEAYEFDGRKLYIRAKFKRVK